MTETSRQGRGGDGLYRKRGIWHFRLKDWTGRRRIVSSKTTNHSKAKQIRREMEEDLDKGSNPFGAGKETFAAAAKRWMDRRSLDAASETNRARKARIRNVNSVLGELQLGRFNGDVLRQYQILRSEKLKPASVNAETKIIISVLKENHLWLRIAEDFKPLREPKTIGRKLKPAELEKLMRVSEERQDISVIFLVLRFVLETGIRHKEARMLRVGSIDLDAPAVRVARDTTKTDAGDRLIPLTLAGAQTAQQLLARAASLGANRPDHYVFPATRFVDGRRVPDPTKPQESFKDAWQTLRRLADVDPRLRLHDLRHHVQTDMAAAGVPGAVAMRLMGWKSPAMLKRYEHLEDEELRSGIDRMEAFRAARVEPAPKPPHRAAVIQMPARLPRNAS